MTYAVGLRLDEGLVMLSDTRTNAGLDHIASFRKMYTYEEPGERVIVVLTAGNLSVTQTTMARLDTLIAESGASDAETIMTAPRMLTVADLIGAELAKVNADIGAKLGRKAQSGAGASLMVGGQVKGGEARLFLIYPEGNYIEAHPETPFFQIGEHKYGKPILDRVVTTHSSLADGRKAALLSMDSTLRSNLSVGMPLDLAVIPAGACRLAERRRIPADDAAFGQMSRDWSRALRDAFSKIQI